VLTFLSLVCIVTSDVYLIDNNEQSNSETLLS